ncbi:hypothetical protein [Paenibacillus oleatilyticus]|uniref:Secreted protein n=1 Tax=Paenibacillus oleatilyticus TaxID=2594886 RepID=A0ABV4UVB4_9BACL
MVVSVVHADAVASAASAAASAAEDAVAEAVAAAEVAEDVAEVADIVAEDVAVKSLTGIARKYQPLQMRLRSKPQGLERPLKKN